MKLCLIKAGIEILFPLRGIRFERVRLYQKCYIADILQRDVFQNFPCFFFRRFSTIDTLETARLFHAIIKMSTF